MNTKGFDWKRFHAYRVFDEFLERFVLQQKSYVTRHNEQLDLEAAFEDIRVRFVAPVYDSGASFEEKVAFQFEGAPEQTKIVFANVEYLWAMPMENISSEKKRFYAQRWFTDSKEVVDGEEYFFNDPHTIANPGSRYLFNKYWELVAALRVLSLVTAKSDFSNLAELKKKIAEICHTAIDEGVPSEQKFAASKACGIHSALMHLADPERYESIVSASHRRQICAVFKHVVVKPSKDQEVLLKQIRSILYGSYGREGNTDGKYRWFFYLKDVLPLWIDKKTKKEQQVSSAVFDVHLEEYAVDLEGDRDEFTGFRIRRSAKLARQAKVRDSHTCRACQFHFEGQIVHVHHLDPLREYKEPRATKLKDLVTLCPTCHYLAHYWLRQDEQQFKHLEFLLTKLKVNRNISVLR